MDSLSKTWIKFVPMGNLTRPEKRDGFLHEKLYVVPRPLLGRLCSNPALHGLSVTDAGCFPQARYHLRQRPTGCGEHIFIYCTDGSGFILIGDHEFILQAGQAATIPGGVPHQYGASRQDPWTIYWFHVVGDFVPIYVPHALLGKPVAVSQESKADLIALFDRIFTSLSRDNTEPHMLTAGASAALILLSVYRHDRPLPEAKGGPGIREVEDLVAYIQDHLKERITLNMLCGRSYLSMSRLTQLFREVTGHAPIEFVLHQRVQRACYYLDSTPDPISRIAEHVGFDDQFYFSRVFRKIVGMSPRQYRQRRGE
jgi:AraC family transcriptional regulator of arabinose operon